MKIVFVLTNNFKFDQNVGKDFFFLKKKQSVFPFAQKKGFIVPWESTNNLKRKGLMIQCSCSKEYRLGVAAYNKFNTLECLMIFVRPVVHEPDMDHELYRYFATPRRFRNIHSSVPGKILIKKRNIKKEITEPIASTSTTGPSIMMSSSQLQFDGFQAKTSSNYESQSSDMNNNSDQYVDLNREILVQTFTQPI